MKIISHAVVVVEVLCLLFAVNSFAQRKTVVTIGGSWWNADYNWEVEKGDVEPQVDPGNNFGPYLSISHNRWNMGISYLSGKYPIKEVAFGGTSYAVDNVDMTRGDLNVTVGYRVHRLVNIFAGMKHLKWGMEIENTDPFYPDESQTDEYTYSGPLYGGGVSIVVPIGTAGLYGFGSFAVLGGTIVLESKEYDFDLLESRTNELDFAAGLSALNAGLGYRFPSGLAINAGYRGDYIATESEEILGVSAKENVQIQGLILTLSYSFK